MNKMQNTRKSFSLPPNVSFRKERLSYGWSYVFRHTELGELGRILLQGRPDGQTHVTCEVVGVPDDPMTAQRAAIFEPLSRKMTRQLDMATGGTGEGSSMDPLPHPPDPQQRIASKLMQCETCGAGVALLVFADDATDPGGLEDDARLMYPKVVDLNVPTWVIGPPLDAVLPPLEQPALTLKIWPEREPICSLSPNEFNPILDRLMTTHCR